MIVSRKEKSADSSVLEMLEHYVGQPHGFVDPAFVERGFVKRDQGVDKVRIVVEVGVDLGLAVTPGMQEAAVGPRHLLQDEIGGFFRGDEVLRLVENARG